MRYVPDFPAAGLLRCLESGRDAAVENAAGSAFAFLLAQLQPFLKAPALIVTADAEGMFPLCGDLELLGRSACVRQFPAWDLLPVETDRPDPDVATERVAALRALAYPRGAGEQPLVVAPAAALLQPVVPPERLQQGKLSVRLGAEISPEALAARLLDAGLEAVTQVEARGQFARRGGIMDVFPAFAEEPVRLEWFGDTVETLRFFDPLTQQGGAAAEGDTLLVDLTMDCFRSAYEGGRRYTLFDYAPPGTLLFLVGPERIEFVAGLYFSGFDENAARVFSLAEAAQRARGLAKACVASLTGEDWRAETWGAARGPERFDLGARGVERFAGGAETSFAEMRGFVAGGGKLTVFCQNQAERQRLGELLREKAADVAGVVSLELGRLSAGFSVPGAAVVGDHEIFGRHAPRRVVRRRYSGLPLGDFSELREGDYVVHVANGIARYEGVERLEQGGTEQDYLRLRFAEDARIYVPLSHIELVQRYVGSRDARPQLSRLGGKTWAGRKRAAEAAARDVAADLLRLQAVRRSLPGAALPEDDALQLEFDAAFPYEETPDQLSAAAEIRADQERPHPMDRLLCGDVGFGKTELAVRAAFKVVNAGKQAAVLVPTTVLAEQHYRTFGERMADYPVNVACLSRFRSPAEQKRIVAGLRDGTVDVVIGTHRLLSRDVAFRDLGLAVIDEEQRFGVEHKERLKELRASVDVLTMTATPIPRTLHLSLMGLRDISNLATPPADRQAIRTEVVRYSDELVRRAVLRELARGGQCYFVHNRVQDIDAAAGRLAELVPEARFSVGHGQMPEGELLEVMSRFVAGASDVLVCTTIIESGVDIPSVNTLFVDDADRFGLSELHQLRGRVGRYRNQAYAYFLVPQRRVVNPVAEKRLRALEEYSELGAGFRIAMRDLEIRGAGNILGLEQSGHIHSVGFDLYCRLLEKSVAALRGETSEEREPVELDLGARAFVPDDYIPDGPQRIQFYRRLSAAANAAALQSLGDYVRDRYGRRPEPVEQCLRDQALRILAAHAGVNYLGRIDGELALGFSASGLRAGVPRLRTLGRKATPLEGGRWRVELLPAEKTPGGLLPAVEGLLLRLLADNSGNVEEKRGERVAAETILKHADSRLKAAAPVTPVKIAETGSESPAARLSPLRRKGCAPRKNSATLPAESDAEKAAENSGRPGVREAIMTEPELPGGREGRRAKRKPGASANRRVPSERLDRVEVGSGSRRRNRDEAMAAAMNVEVSLRFSKVGTIPDAPTPRAGGLPQDAAKVLGIEPGAGGALKAVVAAADAARFAFGPVTLLPLGGERLFLRLCGSSAGGAGRTTLELRAGSAAEAEQVAAAFLAAGGAWLAGGIVE